MWSSVPLLGLLMGLDPMRLGITLLVISRPRPVQNLLAYWVGCLIALILNMAVPLTLLYATPTFRSFAHDWATSSTGGRIQIGMGVLVLSIAALLTVRFWARRRVQLPTPGGNASTRSLDSNIPTVISRVVGRASDTATEGGSAFRRLLSRAHKAWENGSLWVALVIGMAFGGVGPDAILFVLAIIMASGAAIGTQVIAAIVFVVGVLVVVEITLVSYLAAPAKTQAVLRPLHEWALTHRPQVLVAMCTVVGLSLVAKGISSI
ncbi:MAG: GAP family protein [Mycobacterium sp.]|uniref:GAP family protein n=1 Tax=Mycobacterium sp. TaxID=1785 RepID=UPI003C5DF9B9